MYLRSGDYKPRRWNGVRIQLNERWQFTLPPTPVATPTVCVDLSAFHGNHNRRYIGKLTNNQTTTSIRNRSGRVAALIVEIRPVVCC